MNASEKLCLKWNDFQENISSSFGELGSDKDFTDVTLACEDGIQLESHKVILASSSPFFRDILRKNKHPHPLIYMKGFKSETLTAIVDFLYHGEANIYQEDLDSFLGLAEELKLKGLTGRNNDDKEEDWKAETKQDETPSQEERRKANKTAPRQNSENLLQHEETSNTSLALNNTKVSVELDNLDAQIKSMMTKSDISCGQGKLATCNVCGKEGPAMGMPRHIEANHITGLSHSCNFCGKISRSRNALRKHNYSCHRDLLQDQK